MKTLKKTLNFTLVTYALACFSTIVLVCAQVQMPFLFLIWVFPIIGLVKALREYWHLALHHPEMLREYR